MLRWIICVLAITAGWAASTRTVTAGELLPPETPIEQAIDHYLQAQLTAEQITPAPQVSDSGLIRRLTLDLAGRTPTLAEAQAYVADSASDKRAKLVERLVNSPDFEFHHRNELEILLMGPRHDRDFREYLLQAVREQRSWDQLFQELYLTSDADESKKKALGYLKSRVRDPDDLTNDTSKIFFGVSINCAKCHDHPLVLDWRQDHYYGMYAFFNRTYLNKRNQIAEREFAEVKFKTTEGEDKQAKLMFLTGSVIDEPAQPMLTDDERKAKEKAFREEEDLKDAPPPPTPSFSARHKLVEMALRSEDNHFFSRNIVNRIFARLLGRGLVMPLDQMHSENPPSHPDLLDWLARDLVTHHYDLERLIRGMALSQAYSRSTQWTGPGEPPVDRLFALGFVKPLSPRQVGLSLIIGLRNPEQFPLEVAPEAWAKDRHDKENQAEHLANQIEIPGDNFQVSVSEALFFSNATYVQNDLLSEGGDRLIGKIKSLTDRKAQIDLAFWTLYTRAPDAEEQTAIEQYLAAREDRLPQAWQQVVWSMITSSEMRFCY